MNNTTKDPGLGSKFGGQVERLMNEDGTYNIKHKGGLRSVRDVYKFLIDLSWTKFFLFSIIVYLISNVLFACFYMVGGIEDISGINRDSNSFLNAFFFSVQTFTTVGYGHLSPVGAIAGIISTFEAFFGLMYFALLTGLLYGRFSKPSSKIAFAHNALLTDLDGQPAIMFKLVNQRKSVLLNAKIKSILSMNKVAQDGGIMKEYHRLKLDVDSIHFFPMTWTLVHRITDDSPFKGMTIPDLKKRCAEMIVLFEAFDETFSQNIIEKRSFAGDQWLGGVKFERNFTINDMGHVELNINEINNVVPLKG
ncbi:MAG: inward rectifier potassium channel [Crocinitomicaceae bacterium]|jgi:inward rectifier potassium channel